MTEAGTAATVEGFSDVKQVLRRNLDEEVYRQIKARDAITGRTVGDLLNDAMRLYLAQPHIAERRGSLRDLRRQAYPEGTEALSEQIDEIVYGMGPE